LLGAVFRGQERQIEAAELAAIAGGGVPESADLALELRPGVGLVLRVPTGAAPPAARDADLLMVADARIDNRRELAQALDLPDRGPGADAELLLAAYRKWQEGCLPRLAGDFAFVLWDARRRRMLGARDALGVRPLHWARAGDVVLLASEAQQLCSHRELPRRPDLTALADYLLVQPSEPWRSFWEGIHAVPPGHYLVADEHGPRVRRYWDPAEIAVDTEMTEEESSERFLAVFRRAVGDRLEGGGTACGLLLSGGLDSSAVAVVADELLDRADDGPGLTPYAYHFDELASCDEDVYRQALSRRISERIEPLAAEEHWLLSDAADFLPTAESPFVGFQSLAREALRRLELRGGRVLLTGHGGDAVVAGTACVYADELRRGSLGVLREIRKHAADSGASTLGLAWHWGLRPLLPPTLRGLAPRSRKRDLPDWIDTAFSRRRGLEERLDRSGAPTVGPARRVVVGLIDGLEGERIIAHWYSRLGAQYGVDVRHPFLDRRLVEQVLATPPRLLFFAGRYKMLLRRALRGLLPEEIRRRRDKASFGEFQDYSWRRQGAEQIRSLLRSSALVEAGILRRDRLHAAVEEYLRGESGRMRRHLWFIITAEVWFGQQVCGCEGNVFLHRVPAGAAFEGERILRREN
jgi:asparagine synthase (glutamine-hydrolysing)